MCIYICICVRILCIYVYILHEKNMLSRNFRGTITVLVSGDKLISREKRKRKRERER